MSTSYYLYHIPDKSFDDTRDLQECLSRKELIGVRTIQGASMGFSELTQVFTFSMNIGNFMARIYWYGQFYAVVDEYGNMQLVPGFVETVLKYCKVVSYDERNIPA